MPKARTLMCVDYQYSGSLDTELIVHKKIDIHISANTIRLIRTEITDKSPILMGACRDNPPKGSIGAMLIKKGYSPQYLSYVIPLLIEEGFCKASESRPFNIMKQNKEKDIRKGPLFE